MDSFSYLNTSTYYKNLHKILLTNIQLFLSYSSINKKMKFTVIVIRTENIILILRQFFYAYILFKLKISGTELFKYFFNFSSV